MRPDFCRRDRNLSRSTPSPCADWLYAAVPTRFPNIKIALSEGGIGWVPMLLDRIEYGRAMAAPTNVSSAISNLPSCCTFRFTFDPRTRAAQRDRCRSHHGGDRLSPPDSSWPDTELLSWQLAGLATRRRRSSRGGMPPSSTGTRSRSRSDVPGRAEHLAGPTSSTSNPKSKSSSGDVAVTRTLIDELRKRLSPVVSLRSTTTSRSS